MDLITKLQNEFSRGELYNYLKKENIKGCSRLKKNDLVKLVAQKLMKNIMNNMNKNMI